MATLKLESVEKRFGAAQILKGIDLDVADGEFVAVLGPSGCGKSTLLRTIAGLESLSAGDILLGGQSLRGTPSEHRDIAMVFQSYALYPHMTVAENMTFSLRLKGVKRADRYRRAAEIARTLGLEHHLDTYPARLSGGQRQRVAIGRAMVREPGVFLLDEPLSNLDSRLRHGMRTELKRLHQKIGATMIYITHDQTEAMTLADRIVVMREGKIEQVDTPARIYERPTSVYVAGFVGSPEMNFCDGVVAEGRVTFAGISLAYPGPMDGSQMTIGIRPEKLRLASPGASPRLDRATLRLRIVVVEPLGSETLLTLSAPGGEWKMRYPEGPVPAVGDEVDVEINAAALHLFDRVTGQRLN